MAAHIMLQLHLMNNTVSGKSSVLQQAVYLLENTTLSMTNNKRQTITPDEFRQLAKDFGVSLPKKFLFEKQL